MHAAKHESSSPQASNRVGSTLSGIPDENLPIAVITDDVAQRRSLTRMLQQLEKQGKLENTQHGHQQHSVPMARGKQLRSTSAETQKSLCIQDTRSNPSSYPRTIASSIAPTVATHRKQGRIIERKLSKMVPDLRLEFSTNHRSTSGWLGWTCVAPNLPPG